MQVREGKTGLPSVAGTQKLRFYGKGKDGKGNTVKTVTQNLGEISLETENSSNSVSREGEQWSALSGQEV